MDLDLFAQLNLYGHVSYSEYCKMTREEAVAIFRALKNVIDRANNERSSLDSFEQHVAKYERRQ